MKIKSASQTANLGKDHAYLGHFRNEKYLNQGHNDGPNLYKQRYDEPKEDPGPFSVETGNTRYNIQPVLDVDKDFAVFGGDLGVDYKLDKATEIGASAGAVMGRGRGAFKGEKMAPQTNFALRFKRTF